MIKISISSSSSESLFYQHDNSYSLPSFTGAVQWNGTDKCFQVSSGAGWHKIDPAVFLTMSSKYEEVMTWATTKMEEEKRLNELAKLYPAVADARQHLANIINLVK